MKRGLPARPASAWFLGLLALHGAARTSAAQVGTVLAEQKISETTGGFGGVLDQADFFGSGVAALGDLDGDLVGDVAVGAPRDDDGGANRGAVWILFLNASGTVASHAKISATTGGFGGTLEDDDRFGSSVAALGDLDGNGVVDLAVGAPGDHEVALAQGAVWILFLNADGTVAGEQKIGAASGGFGGALDAEDLFGDSVAALDDLDGNGVRDLAVGATGDDDGGGHQGAVWILFLNADGTVAAQQKISETAGGFGGDLDTFDSFGTSVVAAGDLDGDGVGDLAVGSSEDDDGGISSGAVWILFLNTDGTVAAEQKISDTTGGFQGDLNARDQFGSSLAALGDLDGDGVEDLAVGAALDSPDAIEQDGALWILFLRADGTVDSERKIAEGVGGFDGPLGQRGRFGASVTVLGDLDGDGAIDLAVGANQDSDGGIRQGAVWILFLQGAPLSCFTLDFQTEDDFATPLVNGQHIDVEFGSRVTITSAGPNAGLGVFDSTRGGPNDPGPDPDLLVDSGNVLILQTENFPPDADDVFPVPNDDADGGTMSFAFSGPIEARSVRLVDVDAGTQTTVVLTDSSARVRTYTVPGDWTGDRSLLQPGHGTLDLATLAPQPGFGSTATAAEEAGFDANAVVRIDVVLGGSGAIDDLVWCRPATGVAHASATVRNGTGVNPLVLSNVATPVVNGTWAVRVDCTGHASGLAHVFAGPLAVTTPTAFGELLVGGPTLFLAIRPHAGSVADFTASIPNDATLAGVTVSAQGLCRGGGAELTNALDLVVGF